MNHKARPSPGISRDRKMNNSKNAPVFPDDVDDLLAQKIIRHSKQNCEDRPPPPPDIATEPACTPPRKYTAALFVLFAAALALAIVALVKKIRS